MPGSSFFQNRQKALSLFAIGVSIIAYTILGIVSFSRDSFVNEHFENASPAVLGVIAGMFVLLLGGYALLIYLIPRAHEGKMNISVWIWIGSIIYIAGFLAVLPPFLSRDVTAYIIPPRNFYLTGVDPYTNSGILVPENLWVGEIHDGWWIKIASGAYYGPLFYALLMPLAALPFDRLADAVWAYKGIAAFMFGMSAAFFYGLSRFFNKRRNGALLLYLLNPAILINGVWEGHNDLFVVAFLLGAFYFFTAGRHGKSALAFAGAIAVKYIPIITFPWIIMSARGGIAWRRLGVVFGVLAAVLFGAIAVLGFPIGAMGTTFAYLSGRSCFYICSPFIAATDTVFGAWGQWFRLFVFLCGYAFLAYWFLMRTHSNREKAKFVFWVFFLFFFGYNGLLAPWYLILIIPFGLLLMDEKPYLWVSYGLTAYSLAHYFGFWLG
jgi:hypothetical protein